MARPLRVEFEDAIYHLCARGNARQAIFHDERDCARFLKLLSESAQRLREETAVSLRWIAENLYMGTWTHVSNRLYHCR